MYSGQSMRPLASPGRTAPHDVGPLRPPARPAAARRIQRASARPPVAASADSPSLRDSILVVGGGPAGLAVAAALQRVGLPAAVLECAEAANDGGSALGIWTNGWRALDALGVGDVLRQEHPRTDRVELCREDGRLLRSFGLADCGGGPHEFRGVRRASLLRALRGALAPGTVRHGAAAAGADALPGGGAALRLQSGEVLEGLAVVGADGVRSAVAASAGRPPANAVGQVAIRGVAPYPEGVPVQSIRQVWGRGPRAGMYPISGTEVYWFVCFEAPGAPSPADPADTKREALGVVSGWGGSVEEAVARTPAAEMVRNRIADRWDLPGGLSGCIALAGDALHPMTPNLGQGGCTALEDAVVLARMLRGQGVPDLAAAARAGGGEEGRRALAAAVQEAFRRYERERAARCLPLTVRAHAMGALLQLPLAPVVAARDLYVARGFSPGHFLDHATYDCGRL